ncbi:MAG: nucleotidyltransferase [Clostridia bacterium]|nr:nucleotidyltransferase [Clostridia bacterium]
MKEPVLVIMAAGMGSRFGGAKQITPVDEQGHILIDFSLFDAYRAGFRELVFIIKEESRATFEESIGKRMEKYFRVRYVYQDIARLPEGFSVPEGRVKPWGTGHAVACCQGVVDGPFAVINADDYYGPSAFAAVYDFLKNNQEDSQYAMVGYRVGNTLTENGSVSRGVCCVEDGKLVDVTERTYIVPQGDGAAYSEDGGETFTALDKNALVSMNLWGFTGAFIDQIWARFPAFLEENLAKNPLKCEYYLPFVVNEQLKDGSAVVQMLPCEEKWYGVTYREDLGRVQAAVAEMKEKGLYKKEIWS